MSKELSDDRQKVIPRFPFLPPFEAGLFVCDLDASHRLLLNKFNVVNRHVLIVTSTFQPQSMTLPTDTLAHLIIYIKALSGLAFHNHGNDSGTSQPHFHVQIIPRYESERVQDAPLSYLMKKQDFLFDQAGIIESLPYKHLAIRFRPDQFNVANVELYYRSMLRQLNLGPQSSYSLLLTSDYLTVGWPCEDITCLERMCDICADYPKAF